MFGSGTKTGEVTPLIVPSTMFGSEDTKSPALPHTLPGPLDPMAGCRRGPEAEAVTQPPELNGGKVGILKRPLH